MKLLNKEVFDSRIYKDVSALKIDKLIDKRGNALLDIEYKIDTRRYNDSLAFSNWEFSTIIPTEETNRKLELCDEFINKLGSINYKDYVLLVFTIEAYRNDYELIKIEVYDNHDKLVCKISKDDK